MLLYSVLVPCRCELVRDNITKIHQVIKALLQYFKSCGSIYAIKVSQLPLLPQGCIAKDREIGLGFELTICLYPYVHLCFRRMRY